MEETKQMTCEFEVENLRRALDMEMKAFSKFLSTESCHKKLCQDWTSAINLYSTVWETNCSTDTLRCTVAPKCTTELLPVCKRAPALIQNCNESKSAFCVLSSSHECNYRCVFAMHKTFVHLEVQNTHALIDIRNVFQILTTLLGNDPVLFGGWSQ